LLTYVERGLMTLSVRDAVRDVSGEFKTLYFVFSKTEAKRLCVRTSSCV